MAKSTEVRETRVRWNDIEWTQVLTQAVPLAELEKLELARAVMRVQTDVLPRERIRKHALIRTTMRLGRHKAALAKVQAMIAAAAVKSRKRPGPRGNNETRARHMPGATPTVRMLRAGYRGGFRWTEYEWALVAQEVDRLRAGQARKVSDCNAVIDAQDNVLPTSRRRAIEGIKKEFYGTRAARSKKKAG